MTTPQNDEPTDTEAALRRFARALFSDAEQPDESTETDTPPDDDRRPARGLFA